MDFLKLTDRHLGVDLRRVEVLVTQHGLDVTHIGSAL